MIETAQREVFGHIPHALEIGHYILSVLAVVFLAYGIYRRFNVWRMGKIEGREGAFKPGIKGMLEDVFLLLESPSIMSNYFKRVWRFIRDGALQLRPLRELYPGLMHILIFWGIAILLVGALVDAMDHYISLFLSPALHFNKGIFYIGFSVFLEFVGLGFVLGPAIAIFRRYIQRPSGLSDTKGEDALVLGLLLFVGLSGFLLEGLGQVIDQPAWGEYSFVGFGIAAVLKQLGIGSSLYVPVWFMHQVTALGFIAIIPYTKLFHIITSSMTLYLAPVDEVKGALSTPFSLKEMMEATTEVQFKLGADQIEDFTFSQLVSLDGCTRCGRCQDNCPAFIAERPLSPKELIQDLKKHMLEKAQALAKGETPKPLHEESIKAETLWSCTTCRNCIEHCPVGIQHIPFIIDLRRSLVGESKIDKLQRQALMNTTNNYNPWGIAFSDRAAWAADLKIPRASEGDFEYLYFVGCAGTYDQKAQKIAMAMVKILRAAGVKFAILGEQEKCCGEWARRLGEESLFQTLVMENTEVMNQAGVKKIITACPHCFTTLKDEYATLGGKYEVYHQSQLVSEWVRSGKITMKKELNLKVAYHDSCYLGRYNDIYEQPRSLIQAIPKTQLVEIERNHNKSFCCGAGGGGMWAEFEKGGKPNQLRLEMALKSDPGMIVTACPYCLTMFEDAMKVKDIEGKVQLKDVVELVAEHMAQ
ncbi:MAG: (Fe-S)-binding protein [bacterium]|nr:(Fe-S)-binding protein [bacterium]